MLEALLGRGVEPVADLVLNHRDGSGGWVSFRNPDWGLWAITRNDEAFSNPASGSQGRRWPSGAPRRSRRRRTAPAAAPPTPTTSFATSTTPTRDVRRDILRYLLQLKSAGYRGWRYDMVHGFHARWVALYNRRTTPTFSVGEYDWDKQGEQRGWVWHTATTPGDLRTASSVFDFTTQFTLKDNKDRYLVWYGFGHGVGLIGDTTDGQPWKQRAVTFLENHDTGYRTNADGTPQKNHKFDSFQNTWEVEQAYAYILTHPGVPCVYWKHYFDWGPDLRNKIRALVNARKVAGVHSGSELQMQDNARRARRLRRARERPRRRPVRPRRRLGRRLAALGLGVRGLPGVRDRRRLAGVGAPAGNPPVQQAARKAALPVPVYRDPSTITVPDDWLTP